MAIGLRTVHLVRKKRKKNFSCNGNRNGWGLGEEEGLGAKNNFSFSLVGD